MKKIYRVIPICPKCGNRLAFNYDVRSGIGNDYYCSKCELWFSIDDIIIKTKTSEIKKPVRNNFDNAYYRPPANYNATFEVPNNLYGRTFISLARKALNRTNYKMSVRGRGPNRPKTFINDIPLAQATHLAVYIDKKKEAV